MTAPTRSAERRARRQRRQDRWRWAVAAAFVLAGLAVFGVHEAASSGDTAATGHHSASAHASDLSSPVASDGTAHTEDPTSTALPIVGSGSGGAADPAVFTDPSTVTAVLDAARTGVEAVDSYDYRNLNAAIAAGLAATTGDFQTSYRSAMTGAVAATAPGAQTVQTCTVTKLGVTAISSDEQTASTLVFGRLSTTSATTGTTPKITQVTLGVTLQQVNGHWLISAMSDFSSGDAQVQPPGSAALYDATEAGAREVVDLLSFRRSDYDSDFARALAGLTGPLVTEQQGQKSEILASMTAANADYSGAIRCIGLESADGDSVQMLVAAASYAVNSAGTHTLQTLPNLEITVTRVGGQWLVSQFQNIPTGS